MRYVIIHLVVAMFVLFFTVPAFAEPFEVAKVYRDYPGYINPAVCDNPNLNNSKSQSAVEKGSADSSTVNAPVDSKNAAECETQPMVLRNDNPVNVPYLAVWMALTATHHTDLDTDSNDQDISFKNGYGGGVAAGYDFGPARLEIEGSYRHNSIKGSDEDLSIKTLLANAYADFATGGMATPYLGAGIGYAEVEVDDHDDDVFAGQVGAGILFALSQSVAVDLGYRFMMTDDPEIEHTEFKVRQHAASLGLQLRF